jgi:hypothetical protein
VVRFLRGDKCKIESYKIGTNSEHKEHYKISMTRASAVRHNDIVAQKYPPTHWENQFCLRRLWLSALLAEAARPDDGKLRNIKRPLE